MYLGQLQLSSYLDCYVCISGNYSCPLVWIVTFVSRATQAVFLFGLLRLYLAQLYLAQRKPVSYFDRYVSISCYFSCFLTWFVTFVSRQLKLSSYMDCYVCISRNFCYFLIWIDTFLSFTTLAVFLFALLRSYLAQRKSASYFDRYVSISCYFSCFLIWFVTFVSRAILAVFLFGLSRLYLAQF